jgi:hypothetical protein
LIRRGEGRIKIQIEIRLADAPREASRNRPALSDTYFNAASAAS